LPQPITALIGEHSNPFDDQVRVLRATATVNTSPPSPMAYNIREPYPIPSDNPASQYTLLKNVGKGSFSTVYKAMHNDTKKIVAIKQIGIVQLSFSLCL